MLSAESWPAAEVEPVWYRVDLDAVAELVDRYQLWKDHPWYHAVDWQRVGGCLDDVLQRHCRDGVVNGSLERLVAPVEHTLSRTDHGGLVALIGWPVEITRRQLHNGGHRAAAMRIQGVRFIPGRCMRGDVGAGVDSGQVYPVQESDRGGRLSSENCQ